VGEAMIKSLMRAWSVVGRQLLRNNSSGVPYILAQSGVSVGLAPNGTVATNGQITLGTALPRVYSSGIWLYLPSGTVSGGAAGLYWCVMSSTTVGQVYTNFADTSQKFTPYIPTGTLVNAVGSNAAYTQTTGADIVVANLTLPANSLGINGSVRGKFLVEMPSNANGKTSRWFLNGQGFSFTNPSSVTGHFTQFGFSNRGLTNSQFMANTEYSSGGFGSFSNPAFATTIDTTVDTTITLTLNIATATDFQIVDTLMLEVLPS
jgi:hypothetical protein